MLNHRGDSPEFTHTFRALDINDMNQLETLICKFEMLIAYQWNDLPDNATDV